MKKIQQSRSTALSSARESERTGGHLLARENNRKIMLGIRIRNSILNKL
jgi:hypothetical protein